MDQIKIRHMPDIAAKMAADIIAKQSGQQPEQTQRQGGQRPQAPHMERGGVATQSSNKQKITVNFTEKDRAMAHRMSMPVETDKQKTIFYEWKVRNGVK
jgi:hypothetical protein